MNEDIAKWLESHAQSCARVWEAGLTPATYSSLDEAIVGSLAEMALSWRETYELARNLGLLDAQELIKTKTNADKAIADLLRNLAALRGAMQ
jgi:hypothetical protein